MQALVLALSLWQCRSLSCNHLPFEPLKSILYGWALHSVLIRKTDYRPVQSAKKIFLPLSCSQVHCNHWWLIGPCGRRNMFIVKFCILTQIINSKENFTFRFVFTFIILHYVSVRNVSKRHVSVIYSTWLYSIRCITVIQFIWFSMIIINFNLTFLHGISVSFSETFHNFPCPKWFRDIFFGYLHYHSTFPLQASMTVAPSIRFVTTCFYFTIFNVSASTLSTCWWLHVSDSFLFLMFQTREKQL